MAGLHRPAAVPGSGGKGTGGVGACRYMQNSTQTLHLCLALFGEEVALLCGAEEGSWGLLASHRLLSSLLFSVPGFALTLPQDLVPKFQSLSNFLGTTWIFLSLHPARHSPPYALTAELDFPPLLVFHLPACS